MAPIRSKRLRALDGMCRTLCDRLHDKVFAAAREKGCISPPANTSAIYTMALAEAPALLDQLITVQSLAEAERGLRTIDEEQPSPTSDGERQKMLSAIRASIAKTGSQFARG